MRATCGPVHCAGVVAWGVHAPRRVGRRALDVRSLKTIVHDNCCVVPAANGDEAFDMVAADSTDSTDTGWPRHTGLSKASSSAAVASLVSGVFAVFAVCPLSFLFYLSFLLLFIILYLK